MRDATTVADIIVGRCGDSADVKRAGQHAALGGVTRTSRRCPEPQTLTRPRKTEASRGGDECRGSKRLGASAKRPLSGVVVGVPYEYCVKELSAEAKDTWSHGCRTLAHAGAHLRPISLPHTRYALSAYYTIAPAEAASNLARYTSVCYGSSTSDGSPLRRGGCGAKSANPGQLYNQWRSDVMGARKQLLGPEVKRRILIGSFVLSAGFYRKYYDRALALQELIRRDFDATFAPARRFGEGGGTDCTDGVDAILTPTITAPPRSSGQIRNMDVENVYMDDILTAAASLAGLPAVAVPFGGTARLEGGTKGIEHSGCRLPYTLQLIGRTCPNSKSGRQRSGSGRMQAYLRCASVLAKEGTIM